MRSRIFKRKLRPRVLQCCKFGSQGSWGAPCVWFLHLKTGLVKISRWPCSPQTAEPLRFAAVSDDAPIKIGRRSVLLFKEKEAKAENEISISLNEPTCLQMVCANGQVRTAAQETSSTRAYAQLSLEQRPLLLVPWWALGTAWLASGSCMWILDRCWWT